MRLRNFVSLMTALAFGSTDVAAAAERAVVDLMTADGARQAGAQWRHADVELVPALHRAPDADGQPNGAPVKTWDYAPHAGAASFDDSSWAVLDPAKTNARLGNGRLSFHWYRIAVTVPAKLGNFDPSGAALYFDTTLDDYAEVWVDGAIARSLGQVGGSVIAGWNARNHVLLTRRATPGQKIQIAVFAANGPLSDPPANFIWMREAKLVFEQPGLSAPVAVTPSEVNVEIERLDPALDAIVPSNPKLIEVADGFQFTEGPVWLRDRGVLLFSDPNANRIYRYDPRGDGALGVFREQSGYDGADIAEYRQPGSNGISVDPQGRITNDEHGRRRVVRLEKDGTLAVLADRYEGKRLNSPNDLVYRSDGALFFTDPFFGLPKFRDDPRRELDFAGVYVWKDGTLRLLTREFSGPNGIALSPDEKTLYVGNWDDQRKVVMRYDLAPDGSIANGRVFADLTPIPGEDAIDGVKVDQQGNVYVSGPGGSHVYAPTGTRLGTIRTPQHAHDFAWGDDDGRTLYLAARSKLYRIRLGVAGVRP